MDVEHLFKIRGREVTPVNRLQAELPANARLLSNKVGTAPGRWFYEGGVVYVSMPGVPYEMKYLMEKGKVLPRLKRKKEAPFIMHRTILTQGIGESFLSDLISDFEDALPSYAKLAYLPSAGMVRLRLSASGEEQFIRTEMDRLVAELSQKTRQFKFGMDDDTIEEVLGKLLLKNRPDDLYC